MNYTYIYNSDIIIQSIMKSKNECNIFKAAVVKAYWFCGVLIFYVVFVDINDFAFVCVTLGPGRIFMV